MISVRRITMTFFKDQYGYVPINQSRETIVYPFSTIMGSRNTFVLDRSTLKGWIDPKISRGMNLIMTDAKDVYDKKMPFRIINMYDIDKVQDDESLFFLLETMSNGFGADAGSRDLMTLLSGMACVFLAPLELVIQTTADCSIWLYLPQ